MNKEIGAYIWVIPDAYLPPIGDEKLPGHESTCILNLNNKPAHVIFTFYFEDKEPVKSEEIIIGAERTLHLRLDNSETLLGIKLERSVPFSIKVESDLKIVVQHSRMDTRQPNLAYMSTMGYSG
ncbi:sensory rhodopsin transducer [Athalassotoga saccharophila]|uniref:sensory rhodopsin transducer n=1 Tax=Athalassotoga saccharophila TaxID=1441386 RepID=UPI00137B2B6D|nr:sensory rhodopsin transducer [Athalassotoga saccharophila]BBJ27375.1 L-rhamnose mutarotase [Athalassotoga saccharophila]